MKAESTVKRELQKLAKLMKDDSDLLTKRIAWEVYHAIRWAREDVKGWQSPSASAASMANVIRSDIRSGAITGKGR